MPIDVTIRNVPEQVRDKLAARAALEGKSMQEYLRTELIKLSTIPNIREWMESVPARKAHYRSKVSTTQIIGARNADR